MKRIAFTIAILAIAVSNSLAQDNSAMTSAENVYKAMMAIRKEAGLEAETTSEMKRSPESGSVISAVEVIPIRSKNVAVMKSLLEKAKVAFDTDKEKSYNSGNLQGLNPGFANFGTWKGDDLASFIEIIRMGEFPAPRLLYMEVKCADNPQMRTFYGVKWAEGEDEIYGALFLITSKRPDLILNADEKKVREDEDDIMSLLPEDVQNKVKILSKLVSEYSDEMDFLQRKADEAAYPILRDSYINQILDLQKKRQQLIDKTNLIIFEATN